MEEKKGLIAEFKEFIMRGNVLDLAVAVVIGGAFTAIVDALIASIIDPIISLVAGNIPFEEVKVGIFPIGILISAIINFLLIALVVFLMVKAINGAMNKMKKPGEEEEEILGPTTEELLVEIRDLLKEQNGGAKVEPTDKG
jgi:large conductance mechanosensitive channel